MALANVNIELVRNGLGLVSKTTDNVCGICLTGVAVSGKLVLNTPYAIYSTDDAIALGIESTGVNVDAWRHIAEFYSVAGKGRKLWIIVAANTVKLSEMVDGTIAGCVGKTMLNTAHGEISVLGITRTPPVGYTQTTLDALDADVYTAMTKAQLLADEFGAKIMPFVAIIEGHGLTGDGSLLRDLNTESKYRVAIALCNTQSDKSASVGLVLGQLAALPVQRKVSRVKNGALPILGGFLSDGLTVDDREDKLGTINDKRYIILRKFPNKSGYWFNGDFTATSSTDDLNIIARIRTIDKAMKIAYNTYVDELDDDVETNDDGTLNVAIAAYLKQKIENQINVSMQGEISKFVATVDTTININVDAQKIYLDITPKGYLNPIKVVLGFKNS